VVSYNATTFKGADGHLRGVFAAARAITAQKQLEEQIRQQNRELTEATAFLNNVLESSTEYSIIAKDLDGNILAWNEGAKRDGDYAGLDKRLAMHYLLGHGRESRSRRTEVCPADDSYRV